MKFDNMDITVRQVQEIAKENLKEFDRLCRKHQLKYQLSAGTLLGAVRHKGFIPWDDDVDVMMLREDYNTFLEIAREELGEQWFLQNWIDEPGSVFHFTKIRDNNSLFRVEGYKDSSFHQGIFLDVFPVDNIPDDLDELAKFSKQSNRMFLFTTSMDKSRCYFTSSAFNKYMRLSIYYFAKLLPKNFFHKKADQFFQKYNHIETEYVSELANGVVRGSLLNSRIERSSFDNLIETEFEGNMYFIPANYEQILTRYYGDTFMNYPPIEYQQPSHSAIEIILKLDETK